MLLATASRHYLTAYVHSATWLIVDTHKKNQVGNLLTCHQPLALLLEQPNARKVIALKLGQDIVDTLICLLRFHRDALMLFDRQLKLAVDKGTPIAYPQEIPPVKSEVIGLERLLNQEVDTSLRDEISLSLLREYGFSKDLMAIVSQLNTDKREI